MDLAINIPISPWWSCLPVLHHLFSPDTARSIRTRSVKENPGRPRYEERQIKLTVTDTV